MSDFPLAVQSITVDGWTCYDHPNPPVDELGNIWVWQDIDGWFGGLAVRGGPIDRPLIDGQYDGAAPFGGRTVTVSGVLVAPSRSALQRGMDRLAAVLGGQVRRGALVVNEAVVPIARTIQARLAGPTLVKRVGDVRAEWSIQFYSPDPLRYGLDGRAISIIPFAPGGGRVYNLTFNRTYGASGAAGTGRVVNRGDAPTAPVLTFYGPSTNPKLTKVSTGESVTLLMTLVAGDVVTVDCGQRTVIYGGASRRQYLAPGSTWLRFPPGTTDLFYATEAGTGPVQVAWQDAWI